MPRIALFFALALTAFAAEKVEILRDDFGVPHIFAKTAPGAAYASGYVQAEDRLEDLIRNLRKAQGTMSEAFGPEHYRHDYLQRMWAHTRVAKEHYKELPQSIRAIIEAYCAGINKYAEEHPKELPEWGFKVEPWMIVAYSRYTIWNWHRDDATADMRRGGIELDPIPYLGSNEMLIAPSRTKDKAVIAVIDPHLSWYGETRYYEMRVYAPESGIAWSGGTRLGLPFPTLGHGNYVSVAMTTGGPDTGDAFIEEIANGKYKFKGEWRPLTLVQERINVKDGARVVAKDITIEYTHHGPVWAHKDGKAYSMATPYHTEFRLLEQALAMTTSKNLAEMKKALAMRQYMAQNIMVGTVDGDIYYIRNGRVPKRPPGCDPSKPMPGTGECEWEGIHPTDDLVQITNPAQGSMQNCNISPFVMMKDSPLIPERWAVHPYLYNAGRTPAHQRAAMTLEQLASATDLTLDRAVTLAFSTEVYKAETWQARIVKIVGKLRAGPETEFTKLITGWNRRSDADSRGALAYYLFKMSLGDAETSAALEPPDNLSDDRVRAAIQKAHQRMDTEFPINATYGTYFRVGREGAPKNYPVGGGSLREAGMAVPRAISFQKRGNVMVGQGGQTSTQIVQLTRPPKSFMIIPLGESDHPDSPHFDDQARELFSKGRAKSTFFADRKELEKGHVKSRKELVF
ncbi:MAG TPA: penicillin acylase family protein [Bryobacteraceae bacterium]|nr:penicillin acylase family protein [Bryobacteraceae bacterium]